MLDKPRESVRTRIAPSPTGENLHIGNVYTALINYVFAKKHNGKFIVRIEDTDRSRLVEGSEQRILDSLEWLGLVSDENPKVGGPFAPYRQSERKDIYKQFALELVDKGHAFYCFCTPKRLEQMRKEQLERKQPTLYDGFCKQYSLKEAQAKAQAESYVIRLLVPEGVTEFVDVIRGKITFENKLIDDQVLLKADGFPTYHLGVVVDDHLMQITHIIRAEEWISSTPKHILLYNFFGWELPVFAHGPILRNPDKSKLSKRKNPVWVSWYKEEGFLPEAILNYLALMGWSMPGGKELFSLEEMMRVFRLEDIRPVGPAFDLVKLRWMNGEYIRQTESSKLKTEIFEFYEKKYPLNSIEKLLPLVKERMSTLKDFEELAGHFFKKPEIQIGSDQEREIAKSLQEKLGKITEWKSEVIFTVFKEVMSQYQIRMPILYKLLTGKDKGLPLPESVEILGKQEVLSRLNFLL